MKSIDKFVLVLVASLALLLAGCGGGSSTTGTEDSGPTAGETAIMQAQTALTTAEAGLSGATTDAAMLAAYRAIQSAADNLVTALSTHGGSAAAIAAAARKSGNAKAMADDLAEKIADAEMEANMAMAATAAKLYAGISAPLGDASSPAATDRAAAYNAADTAILVSIGDGTNTPTPVTLMEDKKASVTANHGWAGKRYTAEPDDDGMYEAMVYSNVGEPTMGKKFGGAAADSEFEYALTSGMLTIDTSTPAVQMRVASSMFDQSAGVKTFKLPDNNVAVRISGSFHGVSGTYSCTPSGDTVCASRVAADGFELGTVASATDSTFTVGSTGWTFRPSDPNARVTSAPDAIYASYGWWIHKSEDGNTFTASAFVDRKGAVPDAAGITALRGTATYRGGAAGKYALSSSTGGTNDAGHFTARATLQADFNDDTITGTVDNFMGADGMSRNWSVELMKSTVSDTGGIAGDPATSGNTDAQMTKWTIDGTAGTANGNWSGSLYDNGADSVPKVGTGTFYSMFGTDGKMVGAFGVNKE